MGVHSAGAGGGGVVMPALENHWRLLIYSFPGGASGKEPTCQCKKHNEMWVQSLGQRDPLEEDMATQSSILAWRIPWTEEPGGVQSMGLQRVRRD